MMSRKTKQNNADSYMYGFNSSWVMKPSQEAAHMDGQDIGFGHALSLLNGQDAELQLERWKKLGLSPTAKDWFNWLVTQN